MSLLDELKRNNTISNTKGGRYYSTTYNANLDIFSGISRFNPTDEIITKFKNALNEDKELALANLLYLLDIREGKGERLLFKTLFRYLCQNERELALKILPFIPEYGRWDYVLEGIDTLIDKEVVDLIKKQLDEDKKSSTPSLLAKWLPSAKTHDVRSIMAFKLRNKLGLKEKEYRLLLTEIRSKLNLIEKNLTNRDYKSIDFEKVPTKAMLKYRNSFSRNCHEEYFNYLKAVKTGTKKINTKGLFAYEIVRNILYGTYESEKELYDVMWNNQKDILGNCKSNILVMADTSGSMTIHNHIPLANAIGLAIYVAERNTGTFKNHFITFSSEPTLQEIKGSNIVEKVENIKPIISNTDIDKAFELLIETASQNNISKEEMPEFIVIISDMEFDIGVYSKNGTNFSGWKQIFKEKGYELPKIIFWNVASDTLGVPTTKFEQDVAMISGFSINVLENLFNIESYSPVKIMLETLEKYRILLQGVA